jgi:hypothetical protein
VHSSFSFGVKSSITAMSMEKDWVGWLVRTETTGTDIAVEGDAGGWILVVPKHC